MDGTPKDLELHDARFRLSVRRQGGDAFVDLASIDGRHEVAAELIELALKLEPVKFVAALRSGRGFSYGGFCSFSREDGKAELSVDERFEDVAEDFFVDLCWAVLASLVAEAGCGHLSWWDALDPEAQAAIREAADRTS